MYVKACFLILVHFYRIISLIFKENYTERRGYISNRLTKMFIMLESTTWIMFSMIITLKQYLKYKNQFIQYEKIYDSWYLGIVLLMLFNYFIVTILIKKYKILKKG
jgi:uncharacterized membrane protein YobD (UPF0266 family)